MSTLNPYYEYVIKQEEIGYPDNFLDPNDIPADGWPKQPDKPPVYNHVPVRKEEGFKRRRDYDTSCVLCGTYTKGRLGKPCNNCLDKLSEYHLARV